MSSTKNACVGRFFRIFAITTVRGYIFRLEKTRRIPDPFSPSVKSLRFLKSAACTISTNDTPPETGTLSLGEQTCADLRPRSCQRLQNIPGITLTNADPRYLISDSECFHFSFGLVDRESVSHQIFSRHKSDVDPGRARQITTVDSGAIVFLERASFKFLDHTRSPNDISGPVEGTSRRSARAASLPLQFREASSRIEIWTGNQDASPTGWPGPQAADFERSLLIETAFWVVEQCPIHALLLGSPGHPYHSRNGSGRLATLDDGSTLGLHGRPEHSWASTAEGSACQFLTSRTT